MGQTHVLYRFYSATGQLLYVGITMNPPQRFKSHRKTKEWCEMVSGITVENYSSREELTQAERRAIQVEHPLHNVVHAKAAVAQRQPDPETPMQVVASNTGVAQMPVPPASAAISSLFDYGRSEWRHTRYGYLTEEMYQKRRAAERAKHQARADCTLCDSSGYRRNGYLCDHIDHSDDHPLAAAFSRLKLQGAQSGGSR